MKSTSIFRCWKVGHFEWSFWKKKNSFIYSFIYINWYVSKRATAIRDTPCQVCWNFATALQSCKNTIFYSRYSRSYAFVHFSKATLYRFVGNIHYWIYFQKNSKQHLVISKWTIYSHASHQINSILINDTSLGIDQRFNVQHCKKIVSKIYFISLQIYQKPKLFPCTIRIPREVYFHINC